MKKNRKKVYSKDERVKSHVDKVISLSFGCSADIAEPSTMQVLGRIQALYIAKKQLETVYYDADIDKTPIVLLLGEIDYAITTLAEKVK